jgi:hypothetical protein
VPRGLAVPPVRFLQFHINSILSNTKNELSKLAREVQVGEIPAGTKTDLSASPADEAITRVDFEKKVGLELADVGMTLRDLEVITAGQRLGQFSASD